MNAYQIAIEYGTMEIIGNRVVTRMRHLHPGSEWIVTESEVAIKITGDIVDDVYINEVTGIDQFIKSKGFEGHSFLIISVQIQGELRNPRKLLRSIRGKIMAVARNRREIDLERQNESNLEFAMWMAPHHHRPNLAGLNP